MTVSIRPALVGLTASLGLVVGCMNERVYVDPANVVDRASGPNDLVLSNGNLAGDFGPRRGFDGAATEMTGSSDSEWVSSMVTVSRTEETRGTGMIILWTEGTRIENMRPGRYDFVYDPTSLDAPEMTANVCSGLNTGSIDYDAPASTLDVVVDQNPAGGRDFNIVTTTESLENPGEVEIGTASFSVAAAR